MTLGRGGDTYAFLDPWFTCLRGRIAIDDPQRADTKGALTFGRDPETDWWLRVDWWLSASLADRGQRGTQLREALLLVGLLASVDNAAWICKLCELSRFVIPAFMDLKIHGLRANFVVVMNELTTPEWGDLTSWLKTDFSNDFVRDYERLTSVLKSPTDADASVCMLPRLRYRIVAFSEEFLNAVEAMLASYLQAVIESERAHPTFVLDALQLDAAELRPKSSALGALRRVIERGVPVDHLCLPIDPIDHYGDGLSPAWREEYILLARVICGLGRNAQIQPTSVKRISLSLLNVTLPDFELLFSALQHARGVRHVSIGLEIERDDMGPFPSNVWPTIALALMSRDSTTSVEALTVRGNLITAEDIDEIVDAVTSAYPLHAYTSAWGFQSSTPANRAPYQVTIPVAATLTSHYGVHGEQYSIETDEETEAFVIFDEDGVTHVLIVGRGICQVASSALPSKRPKSSRLQQVNDQGTSSLLKSLEFFASNQDTITWANLVDFVELVGGHTLQRLRLKVPNLRDEEIRGVLKACPNLQYLAVSEVVLESMEPFEEAHASALPLRSLEITQIQVPDQSLNDYLALTLRRVDPNEDAGSRLLGLRVGPVSDTVLTHLESLVGNSPLRYLDYTITKPMQSCFTRLAKQQHAKVTGGMQRPLAASRVMAFLGSMSHRAMTSPASNLTDEIKGCVVAYASMPYTRTVLCREVDDHFE